MIYVVKKMIFLGKEMISLVKEMIFVPIKFTNQSWLWNFAVRLLYLRRWHNCCAHSRRSFRNPGHNGPGKIRIRKIKPMSIINYRVSLGFVNLSDPHFDEFGANVVVCLTNNPALPNPPVDLGVLNTGRLDFHNALIAASGGGALLTAIKNQKRLLFENMLRLEATYVQGLASQDLPRLLSSGFEANSTNRARVPLAQPSILSLDNGSATQLILRVLGVANARAYEVQVKNGGGWIPAGVFSSARSIVLPGLTPGQVYSVQVRAVGGSTGYSDWSDPVSHMVM